MISLEKICAHVKNGGVLAYPTDTLYGLGADPFNGRAVRRVFALKRTEPHPISAAFPSFEEASEFAYLPQWARTLLPGPVTIVARARREVRYISDNGSIGIRVPDNGTALEILKRCGPLTATSANLHGGPDMTPAEIKETFGENVLLVEGEEPGYMRPSTVIDVRQGLDIIREGAVPFGRIRELYRNRS